MWKLYAVVFICAASATPVAQASETVTYTYDAKGRIVQVDRSGTVNNNVKYEYTHDKVDNRTRVKVTGSP